jgi:molybdenum cofactor biosynthesis protein B
MARCVVLTCSDSRTLKTDAGGTYLAEALAAHGHQVLLRRIVADEVAPIRALVLDAVESGETDVLILAGGTGMAPRDVTPDAVEPLFTKHLPGYGEMLRQLTYAEFGPEALLSRATAGVIARTVVFLVPGAPRACQLAMDRLILPMLVPASRLLKVRLPPLTS